MVDILWGKTVRRYASRKRRMKGLITDAGSFLSKQMKCRSCDCPSDKHDWITSMVGRNKDSTKRFPPPMGVYHAYNRM